MDSKLSKISLHLPPPPPLPPIPSNDFLSVKNKPSTRSASTSLLPRPTKSFTPIATFTTITFYFSTIHNFFIFFYFIKSFHHQQQYRRLPSHVPKPKKHGSNTTRNMLTPSTSYTSNNSIIPPSSSSTTSTCFSISTSSTTNTTSTSSPLKMIGSSSHYARVILQCLGKQFVIDGSNTMVQYQYHHQHKEQGKKFLFDYVSKDLDSLFNNINVSIKSILSQALNGYHGTILSYGAAHSGKASIMLGRFIMSLSFFRQILYFYFYFSKTTMSLGG
ncbi:unnamed protein product [Cunninghamella echinulata]